MSIAAIVPVAAALALGGIITGGLYWGLLNVPESNVLALALSVVLLLLIVASAGLTLGVAIGLARGSTPAAALRTARAALPMFIIGLVIFGMLWWLTSAAGAWWQVHRGEVDAMFIRYLGVTGTGPLHTLVFATLWFVRWVLGLSLLAGLVASACAGGVGNAARGLRLGVRAAPLAAAALALVLITQVLWRGVYWNPGGLPVTWIEPLFVVGKLGLLYLVAALIVGAAIRVFAMRATGPAPAA